jgi:hypothetical protein
MQHQDYRRPSPMMEPSCGCACCCPRPRALRVCRVPSNSSSAAAFSPAALHSFGFPSSISPRPPLTSSSSPCCRLRPTSPPDAAWQELVPLRRRRQEVSLRRQELGLGILRCVRFFPFLSPFFFSHTDLPVSIPSWRHVWRLVRA